MNISAIKEINLYTGKWLAVEVPADARDFRMWDDRPDDLHFFTNQGWDGADMIPLPAGHTYTLIGKADSLTEEQWKGIVKKPFNIEGKKWYKTYDKRETYNEPTAKQSGLSLLRSHGLKPETTLIIQQQ